MADADIGRLLDGYAEKGLFQNLRLKSTMGTRTTYQFRWHYARSFDLVVDREAKAVAFASLFPGVAQESQIVREVTAFVGRLYGDGVPGHQRLDTARLALTCSVINGDMSLVATAADGDVEYAARRLIHIVNDIFFNFLPDSSFYDYQVRALGLDPNAITFA